MSTHKHFDKICCVVLAAVLLLTALFMNAACLGIQKTSAVMGYENKLFDTATVHTIDIIMDDWDAFTASCRSEEYSTCSVVIDGEAFKNVAIRGKGNTSLTQVSSYGNDRYSFKIEFDHYDSANTYYGLDKLCLNNIIQDNTYMKDYLTYQMMAQMGVASPLCSYVYITVNGEDWGLYLAVEGIEESFLQRNYGSNYGEVYKPDSQSMGGGRGNGEKFDMDDFLGNADTEQDSTRGNANQGTPQMPGNMAGGQRPGGMQDGATPPGMGGQMPGEDMQGGNKGGMANGSSDVLLKYTDDRLESYANIFNNAKTNVSDSDKIRLIAALKKLNNGEDLEATVDIEKVIRYFVVHNFVLNFDSYTGSMIHNYYLYEKDGQLQMIPWDYNLAFGGFQSAGGATNLVNYPIDAPVSGGNVADRPMIAWIFANEEYTALYHQYFAEFISAYFDSGYFAQMMDSVSAMIAPYVEKDPTKFCTYEAFETGVSTLKEFCLLRAESIAGQLNGTNTLVDAGDLQIADMGSMNHAMGGDMQKPQGGTNNGEVPELPGGDTNQTTPQMPGNMPGGQMPGGMQDGANPPGLPNGETPQDPNAGNAGGQMQTPGGNGMPGEMGQMGKPGQVTANSVSSWMGIGISAGVLLLGLGFALFFKRRK